MRRVGSPRRRLGAAPCWLDRRHMRLRLALLVTSILSAAILSVAPAIPSYAADRLALVIGNAKYPDADAPLKEPVNDARDVADELKRDAFNVHVAENLTADPMPHAFNNLH